MDFVSSNEHSSACSTQWLDIDQMLYGCHWQMEIQSIHEIFLTLCLKMPLDFSKDDLIEINCFSFGTKYTGYRFISANHESVDKLNDNHIVNFFNRYQKKHLRNDQFYQKWYFIFTFNFKRGIYNALF